MTTIASMTAALRADTGDFERKMGRASRTAKSLAKDIGGALTGKFDALMGGFSSGGRGGAVVGGLTAGFAIHDKVLAAAVDNPRLTEAMRNRAKDLQASSPLKGIGDSIQKGLIGSVGAVSDFAQDFHRTFIMSEDMRQSLAQAYQNRLASEEASKRNNEKLVEQAKAQAAAIEKQKKFLAEKAALEKASADLNKSLQMQRSTFGMTDREAAIHEMQIRGGNAGQLQEAREANMALNRMEALASVQDFTKGVLDSTRAIEQEADGLTALEQKLSDLKFAAAQDIQGGLSGADKENRIDALNKASIAVKAQKELIAHQEKINRLVEEEIRRRRELGEHFKRSAEMRKGEASRIRDEVATPAEIFQKELSRIGQAVMGGLQGELADRAFDKAAKDLRESGKQDEIQLPKALVKGSAELASLMARQRVQANDPVLRKHDEAIKVAREQLDELKLIKERAAPGAGAPAINPFEIP